MKIDIFLKHLNGFYQYVQQLNQKPAKKQNKSSCNFIRVSTKIKLKLPKLLWEDKILPQTTNTKTVIV
jgi:hypothetical protein